MNNKLCRYDCEKKKMNFYCKPWENLKKKKHTHKDRIF